MSYKTIVDQLYQQFLFREPDEGGKAFWTLEIGSGAMSVQDVTRFFIESNEFQSEIAPIIRLYQAAFDRIPDLDGLEYWVNQYRAGGSSPELLANIAQAFSCSEEFLAKYGDQTEPTAAYIEHLYASALGRSPGAAEVAYWQNSHVSAGTLLYAFAQSPEMQTTAKDAVEVIMSYAGILDQMPTQTQIAAALVADDLPVMIHNLYASVNYRGVEVPGLTTHSYGVDPAPVPTPDPTPDPTPSPPQPTPLSFNVVNHSGGLHYTGTAAGDISFEINPNGEVTFSREAIVAPTVLEISTFSSSSEPLLLSADAAGLSVADAYSLEHLTGFNPNGHGYTVADAVENANFQNFTTAYANNQGITLSDINSTTTPVSVTGSNYDDSIQGGSGDDSIDGSDGNDTVAGGEGANTLIGGAGDDTFVVTSTVGDHINDLGGHNDHSGADEADVLIVSQGALVTAIVTDDWTATSETQNNGGTVILNFVHTDASNSEDGIDISLFDATGSTGYTIDASLTDGGYCYIAGSNFRDVITGSPNGGDGLFGGSGDDEINAGDGENFIDGGGGNDQIIAGDGDNYIDGGSDDDVIDAGDGNNEIYGGEGDDTISSGDGLNEIYGGDGDDQIDAGDGTNFIEGGAGADTIHIGQGMAFISLNTGVGGESDSFANNTIDARDTVDNLNAQSYIVINAYDVHEFDPSTDIAQNGDDYIVSIDGGDADISVINPGWGTSGLGYTSTVAQEHTILNLTGSSGDDELIGGINDDTIQGSINPSNQNLPSGNDWLYGGLGNDQITGGSGNDHIYGGDDVSWGDGNDEIWAGAGDDFISGEDGNDSIESGSGNDTIFGGNGNDEILAGSGDDLVSGGQDADIIYLRSEANEYGTTKVLWFNTSSNDESDSYVIDAGLSTEDTSHEDVVVDLSVNDQVKISAYDVASFDVAQDVFFDSGVRYRADFGGGSHDVVFNDASGGWRNFSGLQAQERTIVNLQGTDGNDSLAGGSNGDELQGWNGDDILSGMAGDDWISGGFGADTISGGDGNDTMYGGEDADLLTGGGGDDHINGEYGNDIIEGGEGDDVIEGGAGADLMAGGTGVDTFRVGNAGDSVAPDSFTDAQVQWLNSSNGYLDEGDVLSFQNGVDIIADFESVDRLDTDASISGAYPLVYHPYGQSGLVMTETNFYAYGNYDVAGKTFEVAAAFDETLANDALVTCAGSSTTVDTDSGYVVLINIGVPLTDANFI